LDALNEAERQISRSQSLQEEIPNLEVDVGPIQEKSSIESTLNREDTLPQEVLQVLLFFAFIR